MSMKFTRKGFFKSIFGGVLTAVAVPSLLKAEEKSQTKVESYPLAVNTNGNVGLGTSCPNIPLVVSSLVFQVGERQLLMAGDKVCVHPESEYEFNVDGEKLYRMFTHQIAIVL